jgi:hypothetical protein
MVSKAIEWRLRENGRMIAPAPDVNLAVASSGRRRSTELHKDRTRSRVRSVVIPRVLVHARSHRPALRREMSDVFFDQLGIPALISILQVGSGSHARQTAVMTGFGGRVGGRNRFGSAVGDVNSTLACGRGRQARRTGCARGSRASQFRSVDA